MTQATVLLRLTLSGEMPPHRIPAYWLEHTPMQVGEVKIVGGQVIAGGMDRDGNLTQLPVDQINTDNWKLRKPGVIGSVQNHRTASNHLRVYADPENPDRPFVLEHREPDNLDGTPVLASPPERFATAADMGRRVAALMAAECSDASPAHEPCSRHPGLVVRLQEALTTKAGASSSLQNCPTSEIRNLVESVYADYTQREDGVGFAAFLRNWLWDGRDSYLTIDIAGLVSQIHDAFDHWMSQD